MTVEIRELVIRAVTTASPDDDDETEAWGDDDIDNDAFSGLPTTFQDRDALIQDCVRQVLRILQRTRER